MGLTSKIWLNSYMSEDDIFREICSVSLPGHQVFLGLQSKLFILPDEDVYISLLLCSVYKIKAVEKNLADSSSPDDIQLPEVEIMTTPRYRYEIATKGGVLFSVYKSVSTSGSGECFNSNSRTAPV